MFFFHTFKKTEAPANPFNPLSFAAGKENGMGLFGKGLKDMGDKNKKEKKGKDKKEKKKDKKKGEEKEDSDDSDDE